MSMDYPACDNEPCWYIGNEDRLDEYEDSYECLMISDGEIKMFCDVCIHNLGVKEWYYCSVCNIRMNDKGYMIDDDHYCPSCVDNEKLDDFILDDKEELEHLRNVSCDEIEGVFQKDDDPNGPWLISSSDLMILSEKKLLSENFVEILKYHAGRSRTRIQEAKDKREKRQRRIEDQLSYNFIKYGKDLQSEDANHLAKKVHLRSWDKVPEFKTSKEFFDYILTINAK